MKLQLKQMLRTVHSTTPTNAAATTYVTQQINSILMSSPYIWVIEDLFELPLQLSPSH